MYIDLIISLIIGLLFIGGMVFSGMSPYFKAKAFNDCTGGHATYFTALFTELRVQDCKSNL